MNQLLHTPEGVRDIYNDECERKIILEERLLTVLKSYGYHPIQTPTFEYFDVFREEIGTTPANDLYKFFDREVYLALVSAVAYTLWSILLAWNDVSKVAIFGFVNPLCSVILSALILGEVKQAFNVGSLVALVLVCAGIYIVNRRKN